MTVNVDQPTTGSGRTGPPDPGDTGAAPRPSSSSRTRNRLIGAGLVLVLLIAMVLNTKFLTPQEVAAIAPKPFDPAQTAAGLWQRAQSELPGRATPLAQLVPALQTDVKGAAQKFKATSPNENSYFFPVTVDAPVVQATPDALRLQVPGFPPQALVLVPLTTGINGTVIRDAMGFTFAQAPDQTNFQYVGDELRKLMQNQVQQEKAATLQGKQVTVVGAIDVIATTNTVPTAKPVSIQPISIKVAS